MPFLQLAVNQNPQFRNVALEALDRSICFVLGSDQLMELSSSRDNKYDNVNVRSYNLLVFLKSFSNGYIRLK